MIKKNKTTARDFETFQEYCEACIEILGLKSWEFLYRHISMEEDDCLCIMQVEPRLATIILSKNISRESSEEYLKKLAIHEIIHTLLGSFTSSAHDRYITKEMLEEKEHEIVQILTNVFYNRVL